MIWSFVKLCILFDGFIVFTLFGGLIWIGGIALVWSQVKEAIENAKDKCESEIRQLKGETKQCIPQEEDDFEEEGWFEEEG